MPNRAEGAGGKTRAINGKMKMNRLSQTTKYRKKFLRAALCGTLAVSLCVSAPTSWAGAEEVLLTEEHVHDESCYSTGVHLVCGLQETPGHRHTDACWANVRGELKCTDNTGSHVHTDECYNWSRELVCGMREGEGAHTHTEECYEPERVLICGLEGSEKPDEEILVFSEEPEEYEELFEEEEEIEPPLPSMNPGDGITSMIQLERELSFAERSDPTADTEDELDWWLMFCDMPLSGVWADDLVKVALTQVGYTESELNFVEEEPGHHKGYTRYGEWFGIPYGDWCAMFISFCMYYSEIPDNAVPYNCHCNEWIRELRQRGLYYDWDDGYTPKAGDFVFYDFDGDEKSEHVGIIRDVDYDRGWLYTIEGNRFDYVEEFVINMTDYAIIGYCSLPENPAYDPYIPVVRQNGEVEIPVATPAPTPPSWDTVREAAAGIKSVSITPAIESSWATY